MTKKEFTDIIKANKDIFRSVSLVDATIRHHRTHSAIVIYWKGGYNLTTVVKTLRGKTTDLKNIDELIKYQNWLK